MFLLLKTHLILPKRTKKKILKSIIEDSIQVSIKNEYVQEFHQISPYYQVGFIESYSNLITKSGGILKCLKF